MSTLQIDEATEARPAPGASSADEFIPAIAAPAGGGGGGTVVPERRTGLPEPQRKHIGASLDDRLTVAGAAGAGLGAGILLAGVLGVVGWGWMPFVSYLWFLAFYTTLTFISNPGPAVWDRFWAVLLRSALVVVLGSLGLVVVFTVLSGGPVVSDIVHLGNRSNPLHFITTDMSGVGPLDGLDVGGIFYALVGTLEQIGIAVAITVPLGLIAAVFLSEIGGAYARVVRTIVEAMTALPAVVAGLFIYAFIIVTFTHQSSGFAAALSLTVLMLPIMIRSADVVLRLAPGNLREAGLALGASRWSTVWHVVLPTVRSGLTTAVILATAHGIGETAPVLLTSGVTSVTNFDPFHNNQTSLPLAALEFIESGSNDLKVRGYATAAFLLILVLVLFALARLIGGQDSEHMSRRRQAQIRRRSADTLQRIDHRAEPAQQTGRQGPAPMPPGYGPPPGAAPGHGTPPNQQTSNPREQR